MALEGSLGVRTAVTDSSRGSHGVEAIRSEDPVEVLQAIQPSLLRLARVLDPSHAEDLLQEAFIRTLSAHPAFEGLGQPGAYVRTVLLRLAYRRRPGLTRMDELPMSVLDLDNQSSEQVLLADEVSSRLDVQHALENLPRRRRAIVYLRFMQGMDTACIARILACRQSTIRSQLSRAVAELRARWPITPESTSIQLPEGGQRHEA